MMGDCRLPCEEYSQRMLRFPHLLIRKLIKGLIQVLIRKFVVLFLEKCTTFNKKRNILKKLLKFSHLLTRD